MGSIMVKASFTFSRCKLAKKTLPRLALPWPSNHYNVRQRQCRHLPQRLFQLLAVCLSNTQGVHQSLKSRGKNTWDVCEYLLGFEGLRPQLHILGEVLVFLR
jgi:hypothetical protein